jgi:hypothetical protein
MSSKNVKILTGYGSVRRQYARNEKNRSLFAIDKEPAEIYAEKN